MVADPRGSKISTQIDSLSFEGGLDALPSPWEECPRLAERRWSVPRRAAGLQVPPLTATRAVFRVQMKR